MKTKPEPSRYILLIGVLSLVIVGAVLAYQVYAALVKTQISKAEKLSIKPIDGSIKQEVIQDLQQRRRFTGAEIEYPLAEQAISSTAAAISPLPTIGMPTPSTRSAQPIP